MSRNASLRIKLNGICDPDSRTAALDGGADFLGFIFTPHPTLRITPQLAGQLTGSLPGSTSLVGIFRTPDDAEIEDALSHIPLDYIQLNGEEPPERAHALRQQFGLPIIKTIPLASRDDLQQARAYEQAADYLLLTARPAANVRTLHAPTDHAFDWSILAGHSLHRPWFLGGGINAGNLSAALVATGAQCLDITGGIMGGNGKPAPGPIREILAKRRDLSPILSPVILE